MLTLKGGLARSLPDLRRFERGLLVLAEVAPERLTLGQGVFFLYAGWFDLLGTPATYSDIEEAVGGTLNLSIRTSYTALLEEGRRRDGKRQAGLGWLCSQVSAKDNRKKILRLTPKGRKVIEKVKAAIEDGDGSEP